MLLAVPATAQILPTPEGDSNQDDGAVFVALISTPVGGLAPVLDLGRLPGLRGGLHVTGQLGFVDPQGVDIRNFGLGIGTSLAGAAVRLTGGLTDYVCDNDEFVDPGFEFSMECNSGYFGGIDLTLPLLHHPVAGPNQGGFGAGLAISFGSAASDLLTIEFVDPFDGSRMVVKAKTQSFSATLGAPLSFIARSGDVLVMPHLTPRLAYGSTTADIEVESFGSEEETNDGIRFMVGAGVEVLMGRSGLGLGIGLQKFFIDEAEMTVGINISYRGR